MIDYVSLLYTPLSVPEWGPGGEVFDTFICFRDGPQ